MKWDGFPIGFRFVVPDLSVETKRSCWTVMLEALRYGDMKDVLLFELKDAVTDPCEGTVYICVLSHKPISQSRENAQVMRKNAALMSRLTLSDPVVQENYLNQFRENVLIGMVRKNGKVLQNEGDRELLAAHIEPKEWVDKTHTLLISPNSMKGVIGSADLTRLIAQAAAAALPDYSPVLLPIGDGGEGTMQALVAAQRGAYHSVSCHDADGRSIQAQFGVIPPSIAVIECAQSVGFRQLTIDSVPVEERSSFGVGEMLLSALRSGYRRLFVCVGGTTCTDCGVGLLAALGASCYNAAGEKLAPNSAKLGNTRRIDLSTLLPEPQSIELTVLCDVVNPLLGDNGAVAVFAPQKGADPDALARLNQGFLRISAQINKPEIEVMAGSGAGGGIAYALGCLGGKLVCGTDKVLAELQFDAKLASASAVISAEGSFDGQSVNSHKALSVLADRCFAAKKTLWIIAGRMTEDVQSFLNERAPYVKTLLCKSDEADGRERLRTALDELLRSEAFQNSLL